MKKATFSGHKWRFATVGGLKRVNIDQTADLLHLHELDQKLWTVLSCPVDGLAIDPRSLQLIDQNNDGKIQVPEVLAAVNWTCSLLNQPSTIFEQSKHLALNNINTENPEGQSLHDSAQTILKYLGKTNESSISTDDTADSVRIFENTLFNGDGIITAASCGDNAKALAWLEQIMHHCGRVTDRSGKPGINQELMQNFIAAVEARLQWLNQPKQQSDIWPLANQTSQAYEVFTSVADKIDDFFMRCALHAYEPENGKLLNLSANRLEAISQQALHQAEAEIGSFPLARITAHGQLPLQSGFNPVWEAQMAAFRLQVVVPLLGHHQTLTKEQWVSIKTAFAPYEQWLQAEAGQMVADLDESILQEIALKELEIELSKLIEKDEAQKTTANNIMLVDKLVRMHRDLFQLLNNFVTFYDFYSNPKVRAIFVAGTLYIDQRSLSLCIRVNDMNRHNLLAGLSGMYLLYCQCEARHKNESMTLVAALTNGDIDNLVVGRNGLFYDLEGHAWDATIIKIIENPISIKQAFWTPYRKLSNLIEKQIKNFAAEQDNKVMTDAGKAIEETNFIAAEAASKSPPFDIGKFVGIFAAISLALGALGTALAALVGGFLGLNWWQMPMAITGLLLVISGPSMLLAWFKLRHRNLAPLLDANGWAINARAAINIRFGRSLTQLASLPVGAQLSLFDPYAAKKKPWLKYLLLFGLLAGAILFALWKSAVLSLIW